MLARAFLRFSPSTLWEELAQMSSMVCLPAPSLRLRGQAGKWAFSGLPSSGSILRLGMPSSGTLDNWASFPKFDRI